MLDKDDIPGTIQISPHLLKNEGRKKEEKF